MKLLLTGAFSYDRDQVNKLEELGFTVSFMEKEWEALPVPPEEVEVVVCNGLFLYHDISLFGNLKAIHVTSAGTDRLPLEVIRERRIRLFRADGVYSAPIAEWVVLRLLEIYKNSRHFDRLQQDRRWEKQTDLLELTGKKAAILGYGSIGKEVAKRLGAFGVHVTGVGRQGKAVPEGVGAYVGMDRIGDVLQESDIVIVTLPLSAETKHLLDAEKLGMMKQDSVLIHVSRGGIVDEEALYEKVRDGKFLGVALDVFEEEPLPDGSPFWEREDVFITPHNSFVSDQTKERLFDLLFRNLALLSKEQEFYRNGFKARSH
ncbi:NAD(P)-dependent oxidoreductase [Salimicrobium sp. PL1-032A]|uniref:NAD(P)-dependent oxidoreductase n=1 Tax=Salimicrobium sp. PL1-032A TaxID=3095364 RepID=UPI0032611596